MRLFYKWLRVFMACLCLFCASKVSYAQTYLPGGYWTMDTPFTSGYYGSTITPPFLRLYPNGHTVTAPGTVGSYLQIDALPTIVPYIPSTDSIASSCFISMEMVFKVNGPKRSGTLLQWQDRFYIALSEEGLDFTVLLDTSGTVNTSLHIPFDGIGRRSPEYWFDHEWHHLVVMYNCCTGYVEVYVDGESPDGFSKLLSPDVTPPADTSLLSLGGTEVDASFSNPEARFVGLCLDEIAIYKKPLPPTLIYQHYVEAISSHTHYSFTDVTPFSSLPIPGWVYGGGRTPTTSWDFPSGSGSPWTLLRDCPGPRYKPGNSLHRLYPWVAQPELLGKVSGTSNPVLAAEILLELAQNYHYHLLLGNLKDADSASLATTGTFVNRMLSHVNAYPTIPRFALTNWANAQGGAPNLYQDPGSGNYFIRDMTTSGHPRYTPNRWRWSKRSSTAAMDSLKQDGFWFKPFVDNWFAVMGVDHIDALSENGEVHIPWYSYNDSVFTNDAVLNSDYTGSGASGFQDYESMAANTFNHSYIDSLLIYIDSMGTTYPELLWYNIGGDISNVWKYDRVRTINSYSDTLVRSTPYLYPQTPAGWRHHTASRSGWNRLVNGFTQTIAAGDSLMNPFVSPGFDDNNPGGDFNTPDSDRIRPGQYLGLLKGVMVLGADVFTPFVYNPASGEDGNQVLYHLTIPSYVQALVSHCDSFLWKSRVLWGNLPVTTGIPDPDYTFTTGYANDLIVARKDNAGDRFLITGSVQKMSNLPGASDLSKVVTFNLSDAEYSSFTPFDLTLTIREQGATYLLDRTNPSKPLMIQLDKWHEWKSPEYWCKNFCIEAELPDSLPTDYELLTERPTGAGVNDFSEFTTYLHNTDGSPSPIQYSFLQRNQDSLHIFVRARKRNKVSSSYDIQVSTDVSGSVGTLTVTSTEWTYYSISGIQFGIPDSQQMHWVEIQPDSSVDVDQVYLGVTQYPPTGYQHSQLVKDSTICLNDTACFVLTMTFGGCAYATWYFGDGDSLSGADIFTASGGAIDSVYHQYRHPGVYTVKMYLRDHCSGYSDSATMSITVLGPKGGAGPDRFVCVGDTVRLAGWTGPGTTFVWATDPELSSTTILNPLVTTDSSSQSRMFYLLLTDSLCNSTLTDSAWLFVKRSPPFSPPDTTLRACPLDSTVLDLGFQTDSVVWMPGVLFNDSTSTNPTIGPVTVTTLLTCYVWDPCGCSVDTITVTLVPNEFECCPIANADYEWEDFYISALGTSTITGKRIHVRDTLFVDTSFTFDGCQIYLDNFAVILVQDSTTLTSIGSYYKAACPDCMWEGIVALAPGSFFNSARDTLQDAVVAVTIRDSARVKSDNSLFDLNHIGIHSTDAHNNYNLIATGCTFTTSDTSRMKPPHQGEFGDVGIWVSTPAATGPIEIPFSFSTGNPGNAFSLMYTGIRLDSANALLQDNTFDLLPPKPSALAYTSGVGILATGSDSETLVVDSCLFRKSVHGTIVRAYDTLQTTHSTFQSLNTGSALFSTHGRYRSNVFDGMIGSGYLTDYQEGAGILAVNGNKTLVVGDTGAGNKFMSSDVGVICRNYQSVTCISDTFRTLQTGVYVRGSNGLFTNNIFKDISASGIPVINYTAGAGILAVDSVFGGHELRVTDSLGANLFKNSQTGIASSKFASVEVEGDSFVQVETGAFLLNTSGTFYNNRFRENASLSSFTAPFEGGAIIARSTSLSTIFSLTVGDTLRPNLFIQNQKGVVVTGSVHTEVVGNPFTDHEHSSIWLRNSTFLPGGVSPVRTIRSNTITNSPVGIWLTSLGKNVIRVSRNVIFGDSLTFRTGIRLDNVSFVPAPAIADFRILDNTIHVFGNATHLNGVSNMTISGNKIRTLWPGTTTHPYVNGVFVTNSFTRNYVQNNQISGSTDAIITSVDSFMHGILLWGCKNAVIFNNKIDTVGWHMVARDLSSTNILYCNTMTRGISGLVIAGSGRFGDIGNASTGTGFNNNWAVGTFTFPRCNFSSPSSTPRQNIYVKNTPPSQNPGSLSLPWQRFIVSNNINCPTDPVIGGGGSSGTLLADRINQYQHEWAQLSANDSIPGIARWVDLYGMYIDIGQDDSLLADSSIQVIHSTLDTLSSIFYYDEFGNPVVAPVHISDFAKLDQAFAENDGIAADSIINVLSAVLDPATAYTPELKLLEAFTLQYQTLYSGDDTLSTDQYGSLYALASLCPDVYGLAPFKAQANLAAFGILEVFDGCSGSYKRTETQDTEQKYSDRLVVYPNPTTGELNFVWPEPVPGGSLTLTDLVGHVLVTVPVTGTNISLDLSGLAAGVYLYKIEDSAMGIRTGQFILVKEE